MPNIKIYIKYKHSKGNSVQSEQGLILGDSSRSQFLPHPQITGQSGCGVFQASVFPPTHLTPTGVPLYCQPHLQRMIWRGLHSPKSHSSSSRLSCRAPAHTPCLWLSVHPRWTFEVPDTMDKRDKVRC